MKIVAPGYSGLNFALASSELANLLRTKFSYSQPQSLSSQLAPTSAKVSVAFGSDPAGADIEIDGAFSGSTPSELLLDPGVRHVKIIKPGRDLFHTSALSL